MPLKPAAISVSPERRFTAGKDATTRIAYLPWNLTAPGLKTSDVDEHGKMAYVRMYPSKHSKHAKDFLKRLWYLLDGRIESITRDNGSEFGGEFDRAVQDLKLGNYYSRSRTPTDNAVNERFNRTLQEEFIALGNMTSDCRLFNRQLTEWLIEYNFHRPHQSLAYMTPIEFNEQCQVSGRYSSCT